MATSPDPLAVAALAELLRQLRGVVETLTDDQYARAPLGAASGSIGGHVRHNLDHVAALLAGLRSGCVNYDRRERDPATERDRATALARLAACEAELAAFSWDDRPLTLETDHPPGRVATSAARELAFVISHAIHHDAIVAILVRTLGGTVPAGFGFAPSTLRHQGRQPCVR